MARHASPFISLLRRGARHRIACAAALVGLLAAGAPGQLRMRNAPHRTSFGDAVPAMVPRESALENLLRTGEDALGRSDWKLAIDSLQRIIDDPGGALLPAGEEHVGYLVRWSARRRATELLASMPPEGIAAYRLLYDGKAELLWQRATTAGDESALRTLVTKYLLTSRGDDAADLLAAVLIDRGLAADALDVLERWQNWCNDSDVPAARIHRKRAVCWTLLGDASRAANALAEAGTTSPADDPVAQLVAADWPTRRVATHRESWVRTGGDLARTGHMPTVSPELREDLPWRYILPSDDPDWWEREYLAHRDYERALPAPTAVVSDGRVFVKRLSQIVALDVESLERLWVSEPPTEVTSAPRYRRTWGMAPRNERVHDRYATRDRLLHDYAGSNLAVVGDTLFEIERDGAGTYGHMAIDRVQPVAGAENSMREGARLIARGAATGEVRWARGRTGAADDPLGEVYFLSVPVGLAARSAADSVLGKTSWRESPGRRADELWTVYARRNGIMLGVLDNATGALLREMLLCTVDPRDLGGLLPEAVYPATDGRTLYVTLSVGLVFAVDTEDFTLRWATTYPRQRRPEGSLAPVNWLCGPPIISGRVLVAAPPDCEYLLGLDRSSGEPLWTYPLPATVFYVLGADDRRVWLGGDAFLCLNLADGQEMWRAQNGAALETTGRAALAGDRVHVPTIDGLTTFDADTGALLGHKDLPPDQLALGNLLCLASAMFSVDTNEVRKFPDLTVSYPRQLAQFEADPSSAQAAVRLAWMELLRGEPQRALAVLDQLGPAARGVGRYKSEMTRLRIDGLLHLAAAPETSDAQAVAQLSEALRLTDADFDRLRATLAYSARLRRMGRGDEAYLALWRLGLTSAGDGYVTIAPKLRQKSRLLIAEVLAGYEHELTARQLATIQAATREALDGALVALKGADTRADALRTLRHLGEMDDAGGTGQAALHALGKYERDQRHFEASEQLFRAAILRDRVSVVTAEAMRDLAEQYLGPHQHLPWEASRLLDKLSASFARTTIPTATGSVPAATEVERLRKQVDLSEAQDGAFFADCGRFELRPASSGRLFGRVKATSLFEYLGEPGEAASRYALLFDAANEVHALSPGDRSAAWTAALRLPGADLDDGTDEARGMGNRGSEPMHAVGWCDGQTVVVNGPEGLFGIGLLSGRRLWGVAYEEATTADRVPLRNRLVAVDHGRVACAPKRGVLTLAAVLNGSDVRWERILSDEKIDTVFLKDDYCVTLDNLRERATTYAAANGRKISTVTFDQPGGNLPPIPLVYASGHLVGPADAKTLVCYALNSGEENWRVELPQELRWTFNAGEGYVGAVSVEGHVRLIDVLGGDVALAAQVQEAGSGNAEGIVCDNALLLMPIARGPRGYEPVLMSFDLESGAVRWQRDDFGPTGAGKFALWKLLHVAADVVPVFRRTATVSDSNFESQSGEIAVELIDKRTGETAGPVVSTGQLATQNERLNGEFGLWPGWMLVGTENGIIALPTAEERSASGNVNAER